MKNVKIGALALAGMSAFAGASAAHAQQIYSAIESENVLTGQHDQVRSNIAGQTIGTTYGGADTRALTDFGVNRINASGTAGYEQYAVSGWVDSYTVAGTPGSMVSVTFNFAIDGMASFGQTSEASFNFNVYALRGDGWSLSGSSYDRPQWYSPFANGDGYEAPVLTRTQPGVVIEANTRYFDGFYNYQNAGNGAPGAFNSKVSHDALTDTYFVQTAQSGFLGGTKFYANGFQSVNANGVGGAIIPYSANASAASTRANLVANYSLLDADILCSGSDTCFAGNYPGSNLQLTFNVLAGSTFSLAAVLYADDLQEGTIDFFHTAKMSGLTLSEGATITSQSGTLVSNGSGGYGYAAVTPGAVPEPATWAMLILGFGLIGGAMRRGRMATPTLA